jgi:hypothetical protein
MSKSTHGEPAQTAQRAAEDDHVAGLTRRTVLAGAAVTTAAVTVGVDTPALAQSADLNSPQDMDAFVKLSAALTGVAAGKLAPATDSIEIKQDYFKWVNAKQPAAFVSLLQIAKAAALQIPTDNGGVIAQDKVDQLVKTIEAREDTKFLAHSIVLMWYLGSWYEPSDLKALTGPTPPRFIDHTVISPKAYTQGWLWRVVQAHPMGYSELQFGYWTREPEPIADFITVRLKGKGT